jgi:hypothetical protein
VSRVSPGHATGKDTVFSAWHGLRCTAGTAELTEGKLSTDRHTGINHKSHSVHCTKHNQIMLSDANEIERTIRAPADNSNRCAEKPAGSAVEAASDKTEQSSSRCLRNLVQLPRSFGEPHYRCSVLLLALMLTLLWPLLPSNAATVGRCCYVAQLVRSLWWLVGGC